MAASNIDEKKRMLQIKIRMLEEKLFNLNNNKINLYKREYMQQPMAVTQNAFTSSTVAPDVTESIIESSYKLLFSSDKQTNKQKFSYSEKEDLSDTKYKLLFSSDKQTNKQEFSYSEKEDLSDTKNNSRAIDI
jgi:hypothetical protein